MSKIEQLIKEKCPNGVIYKKLSDVISVNRGSRLTKSQLSDDGLYEVYHGSKDVPLGRYNQYNTVGDTVIVVNTGGIGGVKYLKNNFWCSDGSFNLGHSELLNNKFLYHYLSQYESYFLSQKRIGGVPTIDRNVVENVKIPIPPIEVQEEIVRILDQFSKLEADLKAELDARKSQYNYLCNHLFTFDDTVERIKLGDACYIKGRIGWQRLQKNEYLTTGDYYLITGVNINDYHGINYNECYYVTKDRYEKDDKIQVKNGDIIVTKDGTIGKVAFISNLDKPATLNSHLFLIRDLTGKINNKYLMYLLISPIFKDFIKRNSSGTTIVGLTQQSMVNFEIPVPSLSIQERIAHKMDIINELVNSMKTGIPAEIEARRKQYEYYRNKLLSFEEVSCE